MSYPEDILGERWTPHGYEAGFHTVSFDLPSGRLSQEEDDRALWRAALGYALCTLEAPVDSVIEVGRCSHWLSPHQVRWRADGSFACPTGYGSGQGGLSLTSLPQFDWSFQLRWNGRRWHQCDERSAIPLLRLTLPSRTLRHQQAALHAVWRLGRTPKTEFYGFRRKPERWVCTADSSLDRRTPKKPRRR